MNHTEILLTLHFQITKLITHTIWILLLNKKTRRLSLELELNNAQEVNEEGSPSDCNIDIGVSEYSSVPADSDVKFNICSLNRDQIF